MCGLKYNAMTPLWRHRGFLHLWGAQATSAFGTRIGREAIQLGAVMLLGATPLEFAWLNVAASLPYLLFGLFAGVLIDRVRRRPLLIATDLARAALLLSIPLAAWIGQFSLVQLLVVTFLVTSCSVIFDSAHQAYVPTLIGKDQLLDANSKQESTAAASEIVGPPVGGILVQALGAPIAILCDAVSYVVSALLLWRIPSRPLTMLESRNPLRGLRYLREDRVFRTTMIVWMLMGFANLMMSPLRMPSASALLPGMTVAR